MTISGTISYEFVPPNDICQGLNFAATETRPVRGATVELVDDSGTLLDVTTASDTGSYSFANVTPNTDVRVRVRAELKRTGSPSWDVEVHDNVVDPNDPNPPVLSARPIYAMVSDFNSGDQDLTRNLTARTGWDIAGNSYTDTRVAAPFAVLDSIYSAMQLILSVDPNADFAPLDAFWSINNAVSNNFDIDSGEMPTSFYSRNLDSLFILGDELSDTDEFDDHIIVHEWGHYFEDNFGRSDSVGGPHAIGDRLDPRLAFGEGWATALAGIALNNPLYCDTGPPGTTVGFLALGTEVGAYDARGWYDEVSVLRFIYDLWDTTDDEAEGLNTGADTGSIGFAPIYNTMVGPQASTEAFTTIFSFAAELRSMLPPADQAFLDSQLLREDMTPGFDIWGNGELNDATVDPGVLPVYAEIPGDGTVVNVCTASGSDPLNPPVVVFDPFDENNKLGEVHFLRINIPSTGVYNVNITTTTTAVLAGLPEQSDPDIIIYRDGQFVDSSSGPDDNQEIFSTTLLTGPDTYVADLIEFRYFDSTTAGTFPELMCYDVSFTPQ